MANDNFDSTLNTIKLEEKQIQQLQKVLSTNKSSVNFRFIYLFLIGCLLKLDFIYCNVEKFLHIRTKRKR